MDPRYARGRVAAYTLYEISTSVLIERVGGRPIAVRGLYAPSGDNDPRPMVILPSLWTDEQR
jgi:hypothetical protein